ncbi:MAG: adenylyl-sulfate kinase [Candidatus Dormibacteria bacterium]
MSGLTIWFTGLSGAGKSTIGQRVAAELRERGLRVEVLDGDEVRQTLSAGLGFSKEDRDINIRRIGFVAELLTRNGVVAITAAISPYKDTRAEVRQRIGRFVEVYVSCSIDVLAERDVKGLYKRALAGEIDHFTGVSDPYEAPEEPDVVVNSGIQTVDESVAAVLAAIDESGLLPDLAPRG